MGEERGLLLWPLGKGRVDPNQIVTTLLASNRFGLVSSCSRPGGNPGEGATPRYMQNMAALADPSRATPERITKGPSA